MISLTHRRMIAWRRAAVLGALAVVAAAGNSQAQDYPTRTVRMIVPYPAGGATDIVARVMQEWLTRKWSQPVVIDNRTGAAGNIGTETAFKSDPDGHTILINAPSPMTVNKNLYAKLNFEPSEFVPVTILTVIPIGLIVNPKKIPANTVAEFIAYAKANPGKINAATQGTDDLRSDDRMAPDVDRHEVPQGAVPRLGPGAPGADRGRLRLHVRQPPLRDAARAGRPAEHARGDDAETAPRAAGHADVRRDAAEFRVRNLGRGVPAAEDAAVDRRPTERRL
jgi:hypothetical protein